MNQGIKLFSHRDEAAKLIDIVNLLEKQLSTTNMRLKLRFKRVHMYAEAIEEALFRTWRNQK